MPDPEMSTPATGKQLTFTVNLDPQAQGSMRLGYARSRPVIVHNEDAKLRTWRQAVNLTAVATARAHNVELPYDCPVHIDYQFRLKRPASVKRPYPSVPPDIDKLERAVNDALSPKTGTKVLQDDSRIVRTCKSKQYADNGTQPGVTITITPLGKDNK